jgi:adhesin transport system membrane fusion protein
VKNIEIRSVGGVIKPGEPIMEIVPLDDKMQVETRISPRDIGFIREGLPAMVKFTAYDFTIYGGLHGKVIYISDDALQDEKGQPYYRVKVATEQQVLGELPIIPGMQASVDIVTGKKSVLSYWLKPLLRARADALRER